MPELTEIDHLAIDAWNKMQLLGTDVAFRVMDAEMTQSDMDDFIDRLEVISKAVNDANKQKGKD
jgi:hypothetical protein